MTDKKLKKSEAEKKFQPTVQHESSASNAQDLGIHESAQSNRPVRHSQRKRRHSGSDGADQERGSNH